jgi:ABC-type phosphate transport system substrate-binding protein
VNTCKTFLSLHLVLNLLTVSAVARADVVVIVNPRSAAATMTAEQVSGIFLGKTPTLPSGATAAMVDQPEGSPIYEQFYRGVSGKTPAQVKAVWSRLTFSGKAVPPVSVASSAEVKKFVAANPDAIGYIDRAAVDATVKVVLRLD